MSFAPFRAEIWYPYGLLEVFHDARSREPDDPVGIPHNLLMLLGGNIPVGDRVSQLGVTHQSPRNQRRTARDGTETSIIALVSRAIRSRRTQAFRRLSTTYFGEIP